MKHNFSKNLSSLSVALTDHGQQRLRVGKGLLASPYWRQSIIESGQELMQDPGAEVMEGGSLLAGSLCILFTYIL